MEKLIVILITVLIPVFLGLLRLYSVLKNSQSAIQDIKALVSPPKPRCNAVLLVDHADKAIISSNLIGWKLAIDRPACIFWKPELLLLLKNLQILGTKDRFVDTETYSSEEVFQVWGEDENYVYQVCIVKSGRFLTTELAKPAGVEINWEGYVARTEDLNLWNH